MTKEEPRAAVEEQYGGDDDGPGLHGPFNAGGGGGFKLSKLSNAYMLVYVRVSQWDEVMCRVTKDDIPQYLRERLEVRCGAPCVCVCVGWERVLCLLGETGQV